MTMTIDIAPEIAAKLDELAEERGISPGELVAAEVEKLVSRRQIDAREESTGDYLLRLIEEVRASVPKDAWGTEPTDHARNYKHYLYGAPKEQA